MESYAESFAQEAKPWCDYDFELMSEEDIEKVEREVQEIEILADEQRRAERSDLSTYYPWIDKLFI